MIEYAILRDIGEFEMELEVTDKGISIEDARAIEKNDTNGSIVNIIVMPET